MNNTTFRNPLPGVPAIESPFFDEIFIPERFSETELRIAKDLRDDGYAVFTFPDQDLEARAEKIKAALHDRYPWDRWRASGADMRLQDAWKHDENVRSIATNQAVLELLSKLYGRRAWPFQSLNFPVGTEQHFHTDSIHFSSVPERFMCGVWLALEDIGPDQGPLEYYVGSHRWPIYTNEHVGFVPEEDANSQSTYHELWERMVEKTGVRRAAFHAHKGQALIWAANLLHGGMPHLDRLKTRWSQVTHYYFDDCAYYTPMHSDPFRGLVAFRRMTDLTTMKPVVSSFSNKPVPDAFLDAASVGFESLAKTRRKYRKFQKRCSRAGAAISRWLGR
ncbi:MAG TPA: phytanoyl-CoA dioxygenase family protein [Steroidobacter sp.]|nr:phytanoyl-CoA dioxygenase family protein [Steroidobacter sp.]